MARTQDDEASGPLFVTITVNHATIGRVKRKIYLGERLRGLEKDAAALSFAASGALHQADAPKKPPNVDEQFLKKLGQRLFSAVFKPPAMREAYDDSEGEIALKIGSPRLARLPWELLHDGSDFVALRRGVVRSVKAKRREERPARPHRLKVLVAMASPLLDEMCPPDDPAQPLVVDQEREAQIFRRLEGRPFPADFDIHTHVDAPTLNQQLARACDVLHLIAHGNVNALVLESRHATCQRVKDIPGTFKRGTALQLVVLESCLTAKGREDTLSVAEAALSTGVPAVLGMMESLTLAAGEVFADAFYRAVCERAGLPEALRLTRIAMKDAAQYGDTGGPAALPWEWATPALYIDYDGLSIPQARGKAAARGIEEKRTPSIPELRSDPLFVGRRSEIVTVLRALDPKARRAKNVAILKGEGGIGKTAVANEAVSLLARWFPRGNVFFQTARAEHERPGATVAREVIASHLPSVSTPLEFLAGVARALGCRPRRTSTTEKLLEQIVEKLRDGRERLLVLDNLDSIHASPVLLRMLEALPPACKVLGTSRTAIAASNAMELEVKELGPREALDLALRVAGPTLRRQAREIVRLLSAVGGHPMAIRLAVRVASDPGYNIAKMTSDLKACGGRAEEIYKYVFGRAAGALGDDARTVFLAASLFAPFVNLELLKDVAGLQETQFAAAVGECREFSLLQWHDVPGALAATDLAKNHAWALMRESDRTRFLADLAKRLIVTASSQPGAELQGIPAYVLALAGHAGAQAALALRTAGSRLDYLGAWPHAVTSYQAALGFFRALGDQWNQRGTFNSLGLAYKSGGWWDKAARCYDESLELCRRLGDKHGSAMAHGNMGVLCRHQKRWEDATAHINEALGAFRELEDELNEALALNNLGTVFALRPASGQTAVVSQNTAMGYFTKAATIFDLLGEGRHKAMALNNLANVLMFGGKAARAAKAYEQALELFRAVGDRYGEAQTLNNLGGAYAARRRHPEAIRACEESAEICRSLRLVRLERRVLANVIRLHHQAGQEDLAKGHYKRLVELEFLVTAIDGRKPFTSST